MKFFLILSLFFFLFSACSHIPKNNETSQVVPSTLSRSWARNTIDRTYLGSRGYTRMQPLVFQDWVIAGNGVDGVSAYDQKSGHLKWKKKIEGGVSSSGVIEKNTLYISANDGRLYALNPFNGSTLWSFLFNNQSGGGVIWHDNSLYFIDSQDVLYSLNSENGKLQWRLARSLNTSDFSIFGASTPIVHQDSLYAGFKDGVFAKINRLTGAIIWERKINDRTQFKDIDFKPVVSGSVVFVGSYDNHLYCLSLEDGRVIWARPEGVHSTVWIDNQRLYASNMKGAVIALDVSSGKEIWQSKDLVKEGFLMTPPLIHGNFIIVGESSRFIFLLDKQTGKLIDQYPVGRGISAPLKWSETSDRFFSLSQFGNIYSFTIEKKNLF